ncbi:unnamed protein product [Boreogadus saida]
MIDATLLWLPASLSSVSDNQSDIKRRTVESIAALIIPQSINNKLIKRPAINGCWAATCSTEQSIITNRELGPPHRKKHQAHLRQRTISSSARPFNAPAGPAGPAGAPAGPRRPSRGR